MQKLTLYLTHATVFDFKTKLYQPLISSSIYKKYKIILPHLENTFLQNSQTIISSADIVLAEISYPSTGQGIELGWANLLSKPIICFSQINKNYSNSLKLVSDHFISYQDSNDMINKLEIYLDTFKN